MFLQEPMTAEEFLAFAEQHPDKRFDVIDGEIVEMSPKPLHGRIQTIFAAALETYTKDNPVGTVYTEVLHVLNGGKFIPDVCINHASEADYFTTPPLVAIEIRSDTQSKESQRRKARRYIKHGTAMVILALPKKSVEVYLRGKAKPLVLSIDDTIDGGEVLPGFKLAVREIFA
jgi:Uma2 family endonuclease